MSPTRPRAHDGTGSRRHPVAPWLIAIVLIAVGPACGGTEDEKLRVFAASSLTDVFTDMVDAFARTDAGSDISVQLFTAGSSSLVAQVNEGAPADVLATASLDAMDLVDGVDASTTFARNSLVIAVERSNPRNIEALEDLADDKLLVALCAPVVPCGALSEQLLGASGVSVEADTLEPNVRSVATKVGLGEVDAGLVYRTDADAAPIAVIEPAGAGAFTTSYPIATLTESAAGKSFVEFVQSPDGAAILAAAGFLGPA